ncbi:potassium-transporting ATPase subunit KdpB [Candidatus Berkiella aquae]|uniref:Potassium-transporting ATPase ATP-binding subunit n=1 Tax=Candidatus Berkiella aquae TaxID=295108 RepID=A0A0Q9YNS3_9GAMM|nr:potassium-transporting ATPase subunit KdpB [Candidatus Berkiella aquae]MCS5712354.1 potassium-transporting ATPase subunit KdpB [Candidatus Berkiella aquae]
MLKLLQQAFLRLSPRYQLKNPVMFVTYIASVLTTLIAIYEYTHPPKGPVHFSIHIALWLWFTVLFANFSESVAEKRGKAQAENLRKSRRDILAKLLVNQNSKEYLLRSSTELHAGDIVLIEAGDIVPGDGQVLKGVASIDESAITGESAPVIREAGGDRDAVTAGTIVLSDWLIVRVTSNPGETFLDRMIAMVEGAKRKKTPNEIALSILLAGMTLVFLIVAMTLLPFSIFSAMNLHQGEFISLTVLIALLICLIPTTIGGLLSAIGIAGMDRLIQSNVIAQSGRAVEAAGDVTVLLLDKTGTITLGNRQAAAFYPAKGVSITALAEAAELSSISDNTPEGKSIVALAREKYQIGPTDIVALAATFIPFTAQTRMSGIQLENRQILKGATDAISKHVAKQNVVIDDTIVSKIEEIAKLGSTPLLVCDNDKIMGVIQLKDIIKTGIKERLAELRSMGIKSIMMTGDNPLTAATIATEAGVDDFIAEADPEEKLRLIRSYQESGQLVAMMGDGTNDAPALAQTDVAVAMNSGTQAAKEAANMIDLDSDPTKLIEIVKIGKQLLMTRGALTTFSIANDVAKYFAILPAAFSTLVPGLGILNIMKLTTPHSAILSAVIFNALIIILLIPLALKGVSYHAMNANKLLRNNLFKFGLGGVIAPFIGIKIIDLIISRLMIL